MSYGTRTPKRFEALNLTYLTPMDARLDMTEWSADMFPMCHDPLFVAEDHSFSHAFGVETVEYVDVQHTLYTNARIQYTLINCPSRVDIPTPPREIESKVTWWNENTYTGAPLIPSLPDSVDVWCHMELTAYEVRVIGPSVRVACAYSYQYSLEPVLERNLNAEGV